MDTWQSRLEAEFERALSARGRGNEGQARVCARRAAGIALREHAARRGRPIAASSVMEVFEEYSRNPALPAELRTVIAHLGLRVDESFKLPEGVDLVEEARRLCEALLPDWKATR